jgi:putative ABC transport system permease protein
VDGPEVTVIGVAADVKYSSVGGAAESHVYLPLQQNYRGWQTLVVHTRGAPDQALQSFRRTIAEVDPTLPVFGAMTMESGIASALNGAESAATFAGVFGVIALIIAATGLYALVANAVTERTREIGVRVALGATPGRVLRLVIGSAGRVGAIGLACGVIAAAVIARLLGTLLYGISVYDPITFVVVPLLLGAVLLAASYLPARRATKLDAAAALRA